MPSSSSGPSSRTRGSLSHKSSSRGKDHSEPLREPLVDEIVPSELSFYYDRESLRNQVSALDRVDAYPTQITEVLTPMVRKDCHWSNDFSIIIPNLNQRITSYLTGFSFVYTYPFTLGFRPTIDSVILEFCCLFNVCLGQIGPIIWRVIACLRHLATKVEVPFTFPHLIHLYSPRLFCNGVFTLVARSKRVLVSRKDDKDSGLYARFFVDPTIGLVGEDNVPFPEKWNFAPTMGVVGYVPNFRGWFDKLLKIAPTDGRSWKTLSNRFGWKVKTHGKSSHFVLFVPIFSFIVLTFILLLSRFAIRGVTAEVVAASRVSLGTRTPSGTRISLERAREIVLGSSSAKRKAAEEENSEEEENETEVSVSLTEPVETPIIIPDDDVTPHDTRESIDQLFISGFGREDVGPVLDEVPLSSFSSPVPVIPSLRASAISVPSSTARTSSPAPLLIIPPPIVHHIETGSSSRSAAMRRVIIEVPAESSLLRKSGQADVWLEPLIGPIEKAKLESHKLMKRITSLEKIARDSQLETTNWKEQFESAQLDIEDLQESKNTLEQRVRSLTSELAVTKASSNQAEKAKERLEYFFLEQLSKASEEIR
ncbi:uncharacterized protein [Nicotiana sylvestris]|uniref:uncharacterized protein n=1 Tax=Nicotiana sylvestris TaxID=4096 RepID=UPI00388CBBB3